MTDAIKKTLRHRRLDAKRIAANIGCSLPTTKRALYEMVAAGTLATEISKDNVRMFKLAPDAVPLLQKVWRGV